jgi:hypothetical protein
MGQKIIPRNRNNSPEIKDFRVFLFLSRRPPRIKFQAQKRTIETAQAPYGTL